MLRTTRIVLPENLRTRALTLAHEGHPGMTVMKQRLRTKIWWPQIDTQVEKFVRHCRGCLMVSAPSAPEPMKRTDLPSGPWKLIAMDLCGPLPSGHHLFVVIDYYSRFVEVQTVKKIDSNEIIKKLTEIFARFGFPETLVADNGRQFISEEFKAYCDTNDIKLISTIPYWPQQNGEVERQNRSILKRLIISQCFKRDWQADLQEYLHMYRSTPHCTTGKTPSELMFGHNIKDKLPALELISESCNSMREKDRKMKEKGKEYGDRKRRATESSIAVNDVVLVKRQVKLHKLMSNFEPEMYKVIRRNGSEVTVECVDTGKTYKRNVAHVKRIPVDQNPLLSNQQAIPVQHPDASPEGRPKRQRTAPGNA